MLYEFLFSSRTWDQLDASTSLNSRKAWTSVNIAASQLWIYVGHGSGLTFQQTDRQPDMHGLPGPLNLTARCKSAKLELCLRVSSHRVLQGHLLAPIWLWVGVDHGRRKTYLDSSRGLIAMTIFGEAGRKYADKKTACSCGGRSLGRKWQLMKNQAISQGYLLSSRVVCQCMVSRSMECFFPHDQDSPVTKRRMASTTMRLQIDTHQPQKVGQMPGTGRRGQDLGHRSGLTRPNEGPQLGRCSH